MQKRKNWKKAPKRVPRKAKLSDYGIPVRGLKTSKHVQEGKRVAENPSPARQLWDGANSPRELRLSLLTDRLGASRQRAEAVVDREWVALPLWARRGLKKLAANSQREMTPQEVAYYEQAPAPPQVKTPMATL